MLSFNGERWLPPMIMNGKLEQDRASAYPRLGGCTTDCFHIKMAPVSNN